jgi:hypothetical protein
LLTAGADGLEVEDIEADKLDQSDARGQSQGNGAAVGSANFLLRVHLGDLTGQGCFQGFALLVPLGELLLVGLEAFRAGTGPGLPGDLSAQGGPLVQLRLEVGVLAAENGVALGGLDLGTSGLATQHVMKQEKVRSASTTA